ncbi:MAG: type II secretion system protein [Pseudomonadota bacterium]|nr:type II secretion system protein [Pseudomonadota bacterium]
MPTKPTSEARHARGFTLVELVVTLVIAAILATLALRFIGSSVQGFVLAGDYGQLAGGGRAVIDRMAYELYNALPNSVRVTTPDGAGNQCLEFIPFTHSSAYLDPPFSEPRLAFDIVEPAPQSPPLAAASHVVIHPNSPAELYFDALDGPANPGPIARLQSATANAGRVTLTLDPVAPHTFTRRSPLERVFLVDTPVSFCIAGRMLYRLSDYAFDEMQCTGTAGGCEDATVGVLADNLDMSAAPDHAFSVAAGTLQRNGMVIFNLHFASAAATLPLRHEALLRNVP